MEDAAKHPLMYETAPQPRLNPAKMPTVLRLRRPIVYSAGNVTELDADHLAVSLLQDILLFLQGSCA